MAARKTERIMNLAICLLMARRFVPKVELREVIEGYRGLGDDAFAKIFERDKAELRALGVVIETNEAQAWGPDEIGYRILRRDFELPPIEFTAAELAALGLAAQVWDGATQADEAVRALAKLRAAGADPDPGRLAALAPSVGAREDAFAPLWKALVDAAPVTFGYHGRTRRLDPWALTCRNGAWYVIGFDADAAGPRTYKLMRIDGAVGVGAAGKVVRPAEVDVDALFDKREQSAPDARAVVALRVGAAPALRRSAEPVEWDGPLPSGYQAVRLSYPSRRDVVGELCSLGADVLVLDPPELRDAVVTQLKRVGRWQDFEEVAG